VGVKFEAAQHRALERLARLLSPDYYLAGGVGVAAHLGHRTSRDLDFFSATDPIELEPVLNREAGVTVTGRAQGTLHLEVDGVPVSLLEYHYPSICPPVRISGLPVLVASLDDLACMKLSALAGRGAARDFWDLHSILKQTGVPLERYLDAFRQKYPSVDVGHVIRSLSYFGDAEAAPLPTGLSPQHWSEIRKDFERWVPALE
jgi:hypothetical protein